MLAANNLSDVASVATARTNLGVTATGADTTYAYRSNNLSDLASATTARTNLGLTALATTAPGTGITTFLAAAIDADRGDITTSASGATWTIDAGVVTLAKMANMATDSIIGRATAATGVPEVLTALPFAYTGDVTRPADSNATTIANNAVTLAKMATMATDSILGRATAATGNVEVLTALPFAFTGDVTRPADSNVTTLAAGSAGALNSGTLLAARMPALTGDVTTTVNTVATTIAAGVVTYAKVATAALSTAAEFLSNTASKILSAAAVWAAAVPVTITFSATQTLDFATFINGKITLTANTVLQTPSNLKPGQSGCIEFIQDATGGRTLGMTNASFISAGGVDITLSTAANARDLLFYYITNDSKVVLSATKAVA